MSSSCLHARQFCLTWFIELWPSENSVEVMNTWILTVVIISVCNIAKLTELSRTSPSWSTSCTSPKRVIQVKQWIARIARSCTNFILRSSKWQDLLGWWTSIIFQSSSEILAASILGNDCFFLTGLCTSVGQVWWMNFTFPLCLSLNSINFGRVPCKVFLCRLKNHRLFSFIYLKIR